MTTEIIWSVQESDGRILWQSVGTDETESIKRQARREFRERLGEGYCGLRLIRNVDGLDHIVQTEE